MVREESASDPAPSAAHAWSNYLSYSDMYSHVSFFTYLLNYLLLVLAILLNQETYASSVNCPVDNL